MQVTGFKGTTAKMSWLLPLFLALPIAVSASGVRPSFDCRKAQSPAEKAICRSPALAKLDAEIARHYADKIKRLSPDASTLLIRDQRNFVAVRDARFDLESENPGYTIWTLKDTLEDRLAYLDTIRTDMPSDYTGSWSNQEGSWWIVRQDDGRYQVVANAVEAVNARGVCSFDDIAVATARGLETGSTDDGYRLTREGAVLRVTRLDADSDDDGGIESNCGIHATLTGDYLPTREDPRKAIKTQAVD